MQEKPVLMQAEYREGKINHAQNQVEIIGVHIPFFQLMWLMVKVLLAALPALLIATFIVFFIAAIGKAMLDGGKLSAPSSIIQQK